MPYKKKPRIVFEYTLPKGEEPRKVRIIDDPNGFGGFSIEAKWSDTKDFEEWDTEFHNFTAYELARICRRLKNKVERQKKLIYELQQNQRP